MIYFVTPLLSLRLIRVEFVHLNTTDSFIIIMSCEKVWHRFEAKGKDGIIWKLRIQDLPPTKINEALDMRVDIFRTEEPLHIATG